MTAYNHLNKAARASQAGRQIVLDPGDAGTITPKTNEPSVCVVTGGTTRSLESATRQGIGDVLLVISQTSTITVNSDAALGAGEYAVYRVVLNSSGVRVWTLLSTTDSVTNAVTRAAVASGAGVALVSGGADRTATAPTPVASTVDINTGDAATDAGLIVLFDALKAAGFFTGTWS